MIKLEELLKQSTKEKANSFLTQMRQAVKERDAESKDNVYDRFTQHLIASSHVKELMMRKVTNQLLAELLQHKKLSVGDKLDEELITLALGMMIGFEYSVYLAEIEELNRMGQLPTEKGDLKI